MFMSFRWRQEIGMSGENPNNWSQTWYNILRQVSSNIGDTFIWSD